MSVGYIGWFEVVWSPLVTECGKRGWDLLVQLEVMVSRIGLFWVSLVEGVKNMWMVATVWSLLLVHIQNVQHLDESPFLPPLFFVMVQLLHGWRTPAGFFLLGNGLVVTMIYTVKICPPGSCWGAFQFLLLPFWTSMCTGIFWPGCKYYWAWSGGWGQCCVLQQPTSSFDAFGCLRLVLRSATASFFIWSIWV